MVKSRRLLDHFLITVTGLLCFVLSESTLPAQTTVRRQAGGDLLVTGTLEAVPGYPRVNVQLRKDGQVLTAKAQMLGGRLAGMEGLQEMLGQQLSQGQQGQSKRDRWFTAFLDTGASAFVIGKSTAQRFGIERQPKAIYHEAGLQGSTPMHVSKPYAVALSGTSGQVQARSANNFRIVSRKARLQLVPKPPSNPLVRMSMGTINVIGTPAIRQLVVEIVPPNHSGLGGVSKLLSQLNGNQGEQGAGQANDEGLANLQNLNLEDLDQDLLQNLGQLRSRPGVRLHPANYRPRDIDLSVPLEYVDYTRSNNPKDRGPKPALAKNPVITDIVTHNQGGQFTGDWLLDTGAPASIISTEQAEALGLYQNGHPTRPADYQIPLGGISGKMSTVPGFRIDRLQVQTARGRTITYRDAHVLVHDISITLDGGKKVTLDGVFGTNLLLPTVAGMGQGLGLPTRSASGPYKRIWIDGPQGRLLLSIQDQPHQTP